LRPVGPSWIGRRWQPAEVDDDNCLWLGENLDGAENVSAYALTRIYSLERRSATILLGTDGPARLWLNGTQVHEHLRAGTGRPDQFRVPVVLERGWNTVLVKAVNNADYHVVYLRLAPPRPSQP
jgi:hypothetical protein